MTAVLLTACGGPQRQDVSERSGNYPVEIPTATFPTSQRLSEHTAMIISVRNVGTKTIPDIAVTICNVSCTTPANQGEGTSASAFAENLKMSNVADPSRPVWIVEQPPGRCGYSCSSGGPGGGVTAYSNTWALGQLKPGGTATFKWGVTALKPGTHIVAWQVAGGLNGKAKTVLADGSQPKGTFRVTISHAPAKTYVTDSGQVKTIK
jgi:hypothetical protein